MPLALSAGATRHRNLLSSRREHCQWVGTLPVQSARVTRRQPEALLTYAESKSRVAVLCQGPLNI